MFVLVCACADSIGVWINSTTMTSEVEEPVRDRKGDEYQHDGRGRQRRSSIPHCGVYWERNENQGETLIS